MVAIHNDTIDTAIVHVNFIVDFGPEQLEKGVNNILVVSSILLRLAYGMAAIWLINTSCIVAVSLASMARCNFTISLVTFIGFRSSSELTK